ncbi:hypothetical protein PLICRDRAFT_698552 [Plicaturopsis crispa FD-325 SS-3]|nr:hypothetical protein PLICRDRAFT_698552 [Plicaturopsis crispa FD-325 SS-3]
MDPTYRTKKIVDLIEEEATTLAFLGPNVAPGVRVMVDKVRADPTNLGSSTCFMIDCVNRRYSAQDPPQDTVASPTLPASPASPTFSEADTLYSQLSNDSEALTVVSPALISKFEMTYWYYGISGNPPKLMWRSDFESNPFPLPALGAHSFKIPQKTAHGVFNTPLNAVWGTVAPQILASMKAHGLKYSALKTVRFSTVEDGKDETLGPVVVWIAVRPNTTNAEAVHDATPDILNILAESQIDDVTVEWYEGSVERLVDLPLMSVEDNTSPMQSDDAQGTLTLLFREKKASNGDPSDRILALTNKHVASVDMTTLYELDVANPQHILVCGERRFARAVVKIEDAVNTGFRDAIRLAGELEGLKLKLGGANSTAMRRKQTALDAQNEDNATLQTFFDEVQANWQDINGRRLGKVDWAPEISVRVDDRNYTRGGESNAILGF